jgi:hypothetical protein
MSVERNVEHVVAEVLQLPSSMINDQLAMQDNSIARRDFRGATQFRGNRHHAKRGQHQARLTRSRGTKLKWICVTEK